MSAEELQPTLSLPFWCYAVFITQKRCYFFCTNASKSTITLTLCHTSCETKPFGCGLEAKGLETRLCPPKNSNRHFRCHFGIYAVFITQKLCYFFFTDASKATILLTLCPISPFATRRSMQLLRNITRCDVIPWIIQRQLTNQITALVL